MTDGTNGFSGSKSSIITAIDVPLPGGYTYTDKCITQADTLFSTSARAGAAQIILVLTDGAPTDQAAAVVASQAAIANGIVIVGVGANVGSVAGRSNILALTSNPCPANTGGCSAGLTGAPQCVTPCNDHYVDASTFAVLGSIVDNVVDVACVDPGCQYTWGPWSECSSASPPTRTASPVISFNPNIPAGQEGACPATRTEDCSQIECAAKTDFLLLLDGSSSMSNCDWRSQAWFAKEFVSRLPSNSGNFIQAQVSIMQFSSDLPTDQELTTSRTDVLNVLDCDRCSSAGGTGSCSYVRKSGGTSTVIAMVEAISKLSAAPARDDAKKGKREK